MPARAEVVRERRRIGRVRIRFEKTAVVELVDLRRTGETCGCKLGSENARVRGLACVQPLAHRAVGVEGPESRALRSGEAERPRGALGVEPEQYRARRSRAERAAHTGEVPAAQT